LAKEAIAAGSVVTRDVDEYEASMQEILLKKLVIDFTGS
jgi:hypothetical protein